MTPRERIVATLQRNPVDRLPLDFGGTGVTGITGVAYAPLRRCLGLDTAPMRLFDLNQQLAVVEPAARELAGGDAVLLIVGAKEHRTWSLPDGTAAEVPVGWQPARQADGSDLLSLPDGTPLLLRLADSFWFSPAGPLCPVLQSAADLPKCGPIIRFMDKAGYHDETLADLAARAKRLHAETDLAVVGHFGGHIFAAAQLLRGMADFMCDLVAEPAFAQAVMETLADSHIAEFDHWLEAVGPYIQVVALADDLGTQTGPQVSPDLFRRLIRPPMERLYRHIKSRTATPIFLHSCGSVYRLIPDLIEMGVDILNPVQVSAADMDTARLKKEFGRDLIFWGGGCDTQRVLPFGTPAEVRAEARRRVADLGPDGFVFAQVHNIQPGVPVENLVAMWEAARE